MESLRCRSTIDLLWTIWLFHLLTCQLLPNSPLRNPHKPNHSSGQWIFSEDTKKQTTPKFSAEHQKFHPTSNLFWMASFGPFTFDFLQRSFPHSPCSELAACFELLVQVITSEMKGSWAKFGSKSNWKINLLGQIFEDLVKGSTKTSTHLQYGGHLKISFN